MRNVILLQRKKRAGMSGFGCFFVSVAMILCLTVCAVPAFAAEDHARAAVVDDFSGTVNATQNEIVIPAFRGLALLRENRLGTGMESWSRLELDEGRFAIIEENADIQIAALADELPNGAKITRIYMSGGKAWFDVSSELSENESFEVNTPTCALTVRGTVFSVDTGEEETTLTVYDGTVALRAEKDGVPLLDRRGEEVRMEVSSGKAAINVMLGSVLGVTLGELDVEDLIPFLKDGDIGAGGVHAALRNHMRATQKFTDLLDMGLDDMNPDKVREIVEKLSGRSVLPQIPRNLPISIPIPRLPW